MLSSHVISLIWLLSGVVCARGKLQHGKGIGRSLNLIEDVLKELFYLDVKSTKGGDQRYSAADDVESEARDWLETNDIELASRMNKLALANWDYLTNITSENADKLSEIDVFQTKWLRDRFAEAKDYLEQADLISDPDVIRMLHTWVTGQIVPTSEKAITALSRLSMQLEELYSTAEVRKDGKTYRIEPEFTELMKTSRDYEELKWAWQAWRDATGPKMKSPFTKVVAYSNQAAKDNGLHDLGVAWRLQNYDEDNIISMVDGLYAQILPLYTELHAYVRHKLVGFYREQNIDKTGPIPAHILGNMWAQEWNGIYDMVTPFPEVATSDVTPALVSQNYTPLRMFRLAEKFFTSLGLEPMTDKFWELSMIVRPIDRDVECHPSAEDFMTQDDFRIKMCTEVNMDDLETIHHEMGHVEYFMQYRHLPTIYRNGANAAFHEAIGDTIALSVTTRDHLTKIGLMEDSSHQDKSINGEEEGCFNNLRACRDEQKRELNQLMKTALSKIAFLPFGYLIDKWRWDVFSGKIDASHYNSKWWEYRMKYQGVAPPVERTENDFDPGSKFHVAAFVPYIRYFLSFIGQFQFHEALCEVKGHDGPLHNCDIYQCREAGDLLKSVLSVGSSKPWRDVMEQFTGERQFSTDGIFNYFSPLYTWLKTYNKKHNVETGWSAS